VTSPPLTAQSLVLVFLIFYQVSDDAFPHVGKRSAHEVRMHALELAMALER